MSKRVAAALFLAAFSPLCISATGCMVEDDSSEVDLEEAEEVVYTVTVVHLDEVNGNQVVGTYTETLAQQLKRNARIAELEAQGLGQSADPMIQQADPCLSGMFVGQQTQIWDNTNYTGNRLCLTGTGLTSLNNYCRTTLFGTCSDYWGGNVRSFKTGDENVRFGGSYCNDSYFLSPTYDSTTCGFRDDGTDVSDASSCEDAAIYIDRGDVNVYSVC
jgi:hypothetical protein